MEIVYWNPIGDTVFSLFPFSKIGWNNCARYGFFPLKKFGLDVSKVIT